MTLSFVDQTKSHDNGHDRRKKPETPKASLPARVVRAVTSAYFDLVDARTTSTSASSRMPASTCWARYIPVGVVA